MNRSERRKQIKSFEKKMTMFKRSKLLHESKLVGLTDDDKTLLKKGEHPDKEIQRIYNITEAMIREVGECKMALEFLKQKQVNQQA